MVQVSLSLKEYYDNIYSGVSIFTETWGWFIDIDISTNINNNTYKNNNINTNINKFPFNTSKLQNYRNTVKQLYNSITIKNNNNYKQEHKKTISSRPSMSSRLSDLELQFIMDEDKEYNEKEISDNNIYNKLMNGFCFIIIIALIFG
jgi:hypothetical protein